MDGVTHTYYYAGGKLLRETYGSNTLDFFYDVNGTPYALKYNGILYYYITNLQGDVMRIVDGSGTNVAKYRYDPYGNLVSSSGTMAAANPLRYRGYYFDSETGFYYLQSRYYDPKISRFINADDFASTGQGILGNNMFAYCGNNPISRADVTGQAWIAAAVGGAIAGGLIGATSYLVSNGISGDTFDVGKFAKAIGIGAINGAIGGAAGTMELLGKTAWSLTAGAIAGVYTAVNTDGTIAQKNLSGVSTGAIAAVSTFVGASIETGGLSPLATTFANYGTTVAVGTPAEFVAVAVQTAINHSTPVTIISDKPTLPSKQNLHNFVALCV